MAKLTLNDLSNLQSETTAVSTINANNTATEAALENTLSRDGTSPNTMGADLDMNSHSILNPGDLDMNGSVLTGLADPVDPTDAVPLAFIGDAPTFAAEAEAAKIAAQAAQAAAELAADNFDDVYLGSKSSDPALDNDGNSLVEGQLYWNSTSDTLKVYNGSNWVAYGNTLTAIVDDPAPQLGGDLDLNGHSIPGVAPETTGTSILKGDGSGGFDDAVQGTDYYAPGGTEVSVTDGGTGLSGGTSGGLLYFNSATTLASSNALTTNRVLKGGGAGNPPVDSGVSISSTNQISGTTGVTASNSSLSSGTGSSFTVTQSSPNTTDTADGALALSYALSANSSNNELISRVFRYTLTNNLTGGGVLSNLRAIDFYPTFNSGTTTTNLEILRVNPTFNGTVTNCSILYVPTPTAGSYPSGSFLINDGAGLNSKFGGSIATKAPVTLTGTSGTVGDTDSSIIVNASGSFTLTLPAASSNTGRWLTIKSIAAQTITSASSNVVPRTSATAGTALLASGAGNWCQMQSDGTNWVVMAGS